MDLAPPDRNGLYISMAALNALDMLDEKAATLEKAIEALPREDPTHPGRGGDYANRLIERILADFKRNGGS